MARAAAAASALARATSAGPRRRTSPGGAECVPTTESMTIFNGHGAARLVAVSTSMARRMISSQPRYGRARSTTRRAMLTGERFDIDLVAIRRAPESPGESFPALPIQPPSIQYFLEYTWDESIANLGGIPMGSRPDLAL